MRLALRRFTRLVLVAGLAGILAVVSPGALVPQAHAAPPPVLPPVAIPGAVAGTATVSGTGVTAGGLTAACTGNPVLCLGVAGVGAFKGTCWYLGRQFKDSGGNCDIFEFPSNVRRLWNYVFGDKGDDRGVGPTSGTLVFETGWGMSPLTSPNDGPLTIGNFAFPYLSGPTAPAGTLELWRECKDKDTGERYAHKRFENTIDYVAGVHGFDVTSLSCRLSGVCPTAQYCDDILTQVWVYKPATGQRLAEWIYDDAVGSPWTITVTVTCRAPGGLTANIEKEFTFTPGVSSNHELNVEEDCDSVLPNSHVEEVTHEGGRDGVEPPEIEVTHPTFDPVAAEEYPLCTTHVGETGCWLDLKRNGLSCFGGAYCAGWPAYESEMTCSWGPYSMDIAVCLEEYEEHFDAQAQPEPSPTSTAGTGAFPNSGSNPSPSPSPTYTPPAGAPGLAVDPELDTNDCLLSGWNWNPVNWVLIPIKCALKWAFVPRSSVITQSASDVLAELQTTPPFSLLFVIGSSIGGIWEGASGGCSDELATFDVEPIEPVSIPCEPPDIPGYSVLRTVAITGIVFFTGLAVWRDVEDGLRK